MGSPLSTEAQEELRRLLEDAAAFLGQNPGDRSSLRFHLGLALGRLVEREVDRATAISLAEERERLTRPSTN